MTARRKMPTQQDVATHANVSTATVSRVVNDRGIISADVRSRVVLAIQELNYIPDASARALSLQRSGTLGAIIPSLNNAIFAEGINAFERAAQALGYTLILSVSQQDLAREHDLVIKMIERGVDGLLLVGNLHDERVFERLEQTGVRHVCTWAFDENTSSANVGFDNTGSMFDIVDHLTDLGHQHIVMLAGKAHDNDRARDRINGVRQRLESKGLSLLESRVVEVEYSVAQSRKAFNAIIDDKTTAVICGNDVIAYGALLEAQRMGIDVPGQLSITGFDDLSLSAELSPSLTTVQVGADVMGDTAAHQLIRAVENQQGVESTRLTTQLIVRESSGPVRSL